MLDHADSVLPSALLFAVFLLVVPVLCVFLVGGAIFSSVMAMVATAQHCFARNGLADVHRDR